MQKKCKYCNEKIEITENYDGSYIEAEGFFFHKKCYLNYVNDKFKNIIKCSCRYCKNEIDISYFDENNPQYYYDGNSWFCSDCSDRCKKSKEKGYLNNLIPITKDKRDLKITDYNKKIDNFKKAKLQELNKYEGYYAKPKGTTIKQSSKQRMLTDWLVDNYECVTFPKYFYIQLSEIANGTSNKVNKPIPYEDLLDMWQRKKDWLDRLYTKNLNKGMKLIGINRVYYDLAVLLKKYDSYLNWKKQNNTRKTEIEKRSNETEYKQAFNHIASVNPNLNKQNQNSQKIDISDILNEIFD